MILDTNVYSALQNGDAKTLEILRSADIWVLPLPVVAELRYGFAKGERTHRNEALLTEFLARPEAGLLIPTMETSQFYADLALKCHRAGKSLSNNDIWIAALALETGDTLVTYDRDFSVFADVLGDQLIVL